MVAIHTTIPGDTDKRFRAACAKKFGNHKGNLQEGMVEAIEMWLANQVAGEEVP